MDDMALLSANYSRYQVNITSTDVDRTLMSAAADLAGLFPPQGNEIWNTDIPWQPIPVHTMPASEDYVSTMYPGTVIDIQYQTLQKIQFCGGDYMLFVVCERVCVCVCVLFSCSFHALWPNSKKFL